MYHRQKETKPSKYPTKTFPLCASSSDWVVIVTPWWLGVSQGTGWNNRKSWVGATLNDGGTWPRILKVSQSYIPEKTTMTPPYFFVQSCLNHHFSRKSMAFWTTSYWCLVGNGWEWGLLGWLLIVSQWIIPENSLPLAPVRLTIPTKTQNCLRATRDRGCKAEGITRPRGSGVSGEEMEWDIAGLYSCIGDIGDIIIIINISLLLLVYLILVEWDYV